MNKKVIVAVGIVCALAILAGAWSLVQPPQAQFSSQSFAPSFDSPFFCKDGDSNGDCIVLWNGSNISVYANQGAARKFYVNGDSGDINFAGTLYRNGTPMAIGTAIPTATPLSVGGVITATVIRAQTIVANGTPVFWATPQTKFLGDESATLYIKCVNSNVTDSLTATPVAGATPSGNPLVSIDSITGDAARAAGTYAGGVFTISVKNAIQTPAANTTPAAVQWCYFYTK